MHVTGDSERSPRRTPRTPPDRPPAEYAGGAESAADGRLAVALRYRPRDAYSAPEVVASGRGWIAERILQAAFDHGIKVREDADLAGILAALEIGEEIPIEAFIAVAEILRYVYAANNAAPPEVPEC